MNFLLFKKIIIQLYILYLKYILRVFTQHWLRIYRVRFRIGKPMSMSWNINWISIRRSHSKKRPNLLTIWACSSLIPLNSHRVQTDKFSTLIRTGPYVRANRAKLYTGKSSHVLWYQTRTVSCRRQYNRHGHFGCDFVSLYVQASWPHNNGTWWLMSSQGYIQNAPKCIFRISK